MGVRSVFLAAKLDDKLVGRFAHMSGDFLLESKNGSRASKRSLADVMVYMSGQYGKTLSAEEVEMGLLAAAKEYREDFMEPLVDIIESDDEPDPDDFIQHSIDELPDGTSVEMELDEPVDDWVIDQYVSETPVKKKKSRPGVKPDEFMLDRMKNGSECLSDLDAGISSFDLAIRFYDFVGNDLACPETQDDMSHKIKLAIGATMKELGWKKKMRKGSYGWHPVDVVSAEPAQNIEGTVLRKKSDLVTEEPEELVEEQIKDSLPRLSSFQNEDDDLPWPDMEADFTDGLPEKEMGFVKIVDLESGTEDVKEMEIIKDKTMTYVMSDEGSPLYLEWDAEESIWTYKMSGSNE
jgi:hypothetical protein